MTWNLVLQSLKLVRTDKKLMLFPVLSALGAAALAVPFLFTLFGMGEDVHWGPNTWLLMFAWYCGASFVTIFFNCALAACVQMRFAGEEPSIGEGMRAAFARIHVILLWSLFSATIGQFLQWLQSRAGLIGQLIIGFAGFSWSMATYLMVPVLVMEDRGVMDSVRRSAALLRQTWGEQLISGLAFGWLALLFSVPGIVLGAMGMNGYPIMIAPAVLWFATMFAAFTAAREIFTVVLYRYATTGQAPNGYDATTLGNALRKR